MERKLISNYGIDYVAISTGKFRRYRRKWHQELRDIKTNKKNAADLFRFGKGYFQAKKILKKFKPDVVFTKGGYVSLPVGLAASSLNIPLVIHDSDSVLGVASKMLASSAKAIATGFPAEAFSELPEKNKIVFTGNPVRKELLSTNIKKANNEFDFKAKKPIIFVFAGSQGAESINDIIFSGIEIITSKYNIIHHTGTQGIERARIALDRLPDNLKDSYRPYEFLHGEMGDALFLTDVAVIRPSASSIAEVAAHSKSTILIPSPHSANNHQQKNAEFLVKMGAARIIDQEKLTPIGLCSEIDKILSNKDAKKYLQKSIHEFWIPDSATRIAKLIIGAGK